MFVMVTSCWLHAPPQHDAPIKSAHWIQAGNYQCLMTGGWDRKLKVGLQHSVCGRGEGLGGVVLGEHCQSPHMSCGLCSGCVRCRGVWLWGQTTVGWLR